MDHADRPLLADRAEDGERAQMIATSDERSDA